MVLCFVRGSHGMFIYSRGRTQVEAGTRTVLGIGPGRSPVVSDEVVPFD